ncbi:hypothetical protein [Limnoglobus roseus]|uniref:Uncharacterized protein n=1 Tax=Limnoglobus roseus TaxID=2598579 RepID=A0A5C1AMB5_9BACT|nr:hypothetical protein [Limnoglobus roseus]QEL20559.1 hypothetical protein PX52LOC_07664 [Limnoglobus roseus]
MDRAFVLLMLTAQLTAAEPPPKAVAGVTALYFPTKVGAQRVYAATAGGNTIEERSTVTGVVEKDGGWRVTEMDDGISSNPLGTDTTYLVSGSGVTLVARGGKDVTAAHRCLVLPAKVGDT